MNISIAFPPQLLYHNVLFYSTSADHKKHAPAASPSAKCLQLQPTIYARRKLAVIITPSTSCNFQHNCTERTKYYIDSANLLEEPSVDAQLAALYINELNRQTDKTQTTHWPLRRR